MGEVVRPKAGPVFIAHHVVNKLVNAANIGIGVSQNRVAVVDLAPEGMIGIQGHKA